MSGPKVITYNMKAFQGKLRDFMRLQSNLGQMCKEMQEASIQDEELNIHFDCKDSYNKIQAEIEKNLVSMVFDYEGNINKKTYDNIENQINTRTQKLQEVIKKSESILSDYNNKQKDYNSYKDYLSFIDNAHNSFEKFKKELTENTEKNFAKDNKTFVEDAQKKYGQVVLEEKTTKFNWGFDKLVEEEKKTIFDHVLGKEESIREVRQELLDKIIAQDSNNKPTSIKKEKIVKPNAEIERVSQKIQLLINNCSDKTISDGYSTRYNKLKQSESMNDLFFYQELHDSILDSENTRKNKLTVNKILVKLNKSSLDKTLQTEKSSLMQKAITLINNTKVSDKELDSLKREHEAITKKNRQLIEEMEIKKKEQQFLKIQIINNFEKLGYTVLDDLQVIDFEKEDDFYLQASGQENVLNIKFKDDGSFRYVFQISEKKEELSVEEQKMKLHEMKTTCDDFVNILNDLKKMGVEIDVKSEKPIELNSMITIPEALNSKINAQKKQVQRKQQIKKLYLE
jgi:hypothetical protein